MTSAPFSVVMVHSYVVMSTAKPVRKPWFDFSYPDPALHYSKDGARTKARQLKREGVHKVMCIINVYPKPGVTP